MLALRKFLILTDALAVSGRAPNLGKNLHHVEK